MRRLFAIVALGLLTTSARGEEDRTIERSLSALANVVVPIVDFTDGTTVADGIEYLNQLLRSPDPPPPRSWKIRLELSDEAKNAMLSVKGQNLPLHQILGRIADTIGAELVVTGKGYILRNES